ncbi:MAG: hypothetical protein Q3979_05600 [Actinomycetaceae bacterium]|nr:hypothetical protein [Actinomycetaceae bacterium]
MPLTPLNPDNALMFGADDDRLYLGPYGIDLSSITGVTSDIPSGLIDCGWISDDGLQDELSDSAEKIYGHQGKKVVKSFISESSTNLTATVLETKLDLLLWYWDAKAEKAQETVNGDQVDIVKITIPSGRKAVDLCGVRDLVETSTGKIMRTVYPKLTLGERDAVEYKVGSIAAYKLNLEQIGDATMFSNVPSLIPA